MPETVPGLVSAIIPVFGRPDMLREALDSVVRQTYPSIEIIVVDDGSAGPEAREIAELVRARGGRLVVRHRNGGPGASRNDGLRHARGEFIQYLDSDDLLEPRKFEWQVRALQENPSTGVAYGLTRRVNLSTGKCRDWARTNEDITEIFPSFLMKRGWDTNAPLWRRSVCEAIGPWMPLRCMEDWEHDLRAGLIGVVPVRVREHVATVRDHDEGRASGMSSGMSATMLRDTCHAHESVTRQILEGGHDPGSLREPFARKLLSLSRELAKRSLTGEADACLGFARDIAGSSGTGLWVRLFSLGRRTLGWRAALGLARAAGSARALASGRVTT